MLDKLRLGPKLLLAPCLMLILLSALSGRAYFSMARRSEAMEHAAVQRAARLRTAAELASAARYGHGNLYQLLAWSNGGVAADRRGDLARQIALQHVTLAQRLAALDAGAEAAERAPLDAAQRLLPAYLAAARATIALARSDTAAAIASMNHTEQQFTPLEARLEQLLALENQLGEGARVDARQALDALARNLAAMILLSLALALLVVLPVRQALLRAVRGISDAAARLAAGDLSPRPAQEGRDEIAHAARLLEQAVAGLDHTMRTMYGAAQAIGAASGDLASCSLAQPERHPGPAPALVGATDLAQRHDAGQALALAGAVRTLAGGATGALDRTLAALDSMRADTRRIGGIVGEIDGIAAQIHILALNAAVLAAHAGAPGRAFAMLAEDMRALGRRSAGVAAQLAALNAAATTTLDDAGAQARAAGDSMARIGTAAARLDSVSRRIGQHAARQAGDAAALRQASAQMGQVLRRRSAQAGRAAAAAANLQHQALRLSGALERFYAGRRDKPAVPADTAGLSATDRRAPSSPMRGGDNADRRHGAGNAPGRQPDGA